MTPPRPAVQVLLPTHDRPGLVGDAIESILAQEFDDFSLLVSDNSTTDATERRLASFKHPKFRYLRRWPDVSSYQHMLMLQGEIGAEFFVIFHDDDIMLPGHLAGTVRFLRENPEFAAVGTNCRFIDDDVVSAETALAEMKSPVTVFRDATHLAARYLRVQPTAPYPSYTYRTALVRQTFPFKNPAGKYSDVCFLLDILSFGPIAWLSEPLMASRRHPGQDSRQHDLGAKLALVRRICATTGMTRKSPDAMNYRRIAWCDWLKFNRRAALARHPRRYRRVLRIMLPYLLGNKWRALKGCL